METKLNSQDLVSVAEAARELGRPRMTIYRWIDAGKMTGVEISGILFVSKSEVEKLKEIDKGEGRKPGS